MSLEIIFFERFQQFLKAKRIDFDVKADEMTVYICSQNDTVPDPLQVKFIGEIEVHWVYGYQFDFYGALDAGVSGFTELTNFFDRFFAESILFLCKLSPEGEKLSGTPCSLEDAHLYGPITELTMAHGWTHSYVGRDGSLHQLTSHETA